MHDLDTLLRLNTEQEALAILRQYEVKGLVDALTETGETIEDWLLRLKEVQATLASVSVSHKVRTALDTLGAAMAIRSRKVWATVEGASERPTNYPGAYCHDRPKSNPTVVCDGGRNNREPK